MFLSILVFKSKDVLLTVIDGVNWPLFLLSALIAVTDNVLICVLFRDILAKYNIQVDFSSVGQMYFFGQMAKYIPGRFWNILYHISFINKPGAATAMIFANIDITLVMILRNTAISLALICFFNSLSISIFLFIFGSATFVFFCQSYWIADICKRFSKRGRSLATDEITNRKRPETLKLLLINTGSWIVFLIANFAVLNATLDMPVQQSATYISYFSLAWVAGVIIFIVPAGVGIREMTFILLAQLTGQGQTIGVDNLMAIAVIYRFWQIMHEILGLGVGLTLNRLSRNSLL